MDLLPREELEKLVEDRRGPCVSIFLPTHRAGAQTQQDPIRLKNLLGEARERLLAKGLRSTEAYRLLEPAQALLADEVFGVTRATGSPCLSPETILATTVCRCASKRSRSSPAVTR